MRRHAITDRQWEAVSPLLSGKATDCGVTAQANRLFFNAIVYIMRTGCPWADLPERFGKFNSVGRRFRRLALKGVWERAFLALQAPDLDWVMLDSTVVRAHQHAAGQKKVTPKPSASAAAGETSAPRCTPALMPWATACA